MIYGIVEMFGNIVDTGSIYIICNTIFERKPSTKNTYILVAIFFQSLVMRLLNTVVGNSHWIVLAALIVSSFLICSRFFHVEGLKFALSIFVFFVLIALVEIIVTLLIMKVFNIDNVLLQQNEYRILGILSSKIVTLYILIYFSKVFGMKKFTIEKYSILTLIMMILSLTVFFVATGIYAENAQLGSHIEYIMLIAAIMAIISILMLFVVRRIIELTEDRIRLVAVENEYRNQIEYLKKYEKMTEEIKSRRHDHKNHLISISNLAKNEGDKTIADYVDDILKVESNVDSILGINNKIMSALINFNISRMEKNDIEFACNIDLQPELHVSDVDMTIIMGNLLDNAIEACLNVEDKSRYIDIDIVCGYGRIDIMMKNSSNGNIEIINNHIQSGKKDQDNHGYGLDNIRKTVEKYNGYFKISSVNSEFIAEILL
jgi:signal transduction histidine kinase